MKLGKILDTIQTEFSWIIFKFFKYKPKVLSPEETIRRINNENLSVARYGDGEFRIMSNTGFIGFQDYNKTLSDKLNEAFKTRNKSLLVCSYDFKTKRPMNVESGKWLKMFVRRHYKSFRFFDKHYKYGNTDITRFYQPDCYASTDFDYLSAKYIPLLKTLWEGKRLLIVEGSNTKLGVGNDLFNNVVGIRRIECPSKNAFEFYDNILGSIVKNHKTDELVLVALGPTASILVTDLLIKHNIRAIDVGHVDVVYLWFLNKATSKMNIIGKSVNEASSINDSIALVEDESWKGQIIDVVPNVY